MSWDDAVQLERRLKQTLDAFDWQGAAGICNEIIDRINASAVKVPDTTAKRLMASLRAKRRFTLMRQLAEALINSGVQPCQVRRQYAQALIDDGKLQDAEALLQVIFEDPTCNAGEVIEACGLLGRVYKQRYVNNSNAPANENAVNLQRALELYYEAYRLNPKENLWHGINAVALSARGRRDGLSFAELPDELALAREILATIADKEEQTTPLRAFDEATRLEAYVALGQYGAADDSAWRYVDSVDADAFEISSTVRQLTEVWQLTDNEPPGNHILPILKAGHLKKEGGFAEHQPGKVAEESAAVGLAIQELEAKFGGARTVTLIWYRRGLEQCNSVARVERRNGQGHGTGWLVKASDFFPGREGVLLLTNEHVISNNPEHRRAIFPDDARANFQAVGEILKLKEIVWCSPYTDLDATFVTLEGEPKAPPLELFDRDVRLPQPPEAARLYIIGHPMGGDLQFSIEDNHLLACNEKLLHYRTPTEPGSSGSPVFESEDWRVVALHHGGSASLKRIDGVDGTYEANEGIAIRAIKKRILEDLAAGVALPRPSCS
jgi:tetratricopeptide repeat protein/trypsin-like peptidase